LGCEVVEGIEANPVQGFSDRIKELTGKSVRSCSTAANRGPSLPPQYVDLDPSGLADARTVNIAWYGARSARTERDNKVEDQLNGCPGICEASVKVPGIEDVATVTVCGKTALRALGNINE
jgi:hypothetical protein